jgi:hypothetical protein
MADRLGSFRRECGFYAALSTPAAASASAHATSPLPAPAVWFARHTPATGGACLLFEDLGGAEWTPGDQVAGATPALARAVVHDAAALHAAFWGDARLAGWTASGWLPALDGAHIASFDAAEFVASWPRWRRRFAADADALPPGLAAALDADAGAFPAAAARLLGRCEQRRTCDGCVFAHLTCVLRVQAGRGAAHAAARRPAAGQRAVARARRGGRAAADALHRYGRCELSHRCFCAPHAC